MAYLQIRNVSRNFSGHLAVDNVSIDIDQGEFVSLLGPSGSGKTTLLRMVAGFEHPDTGNIRVQNDDITGVPPQKRNIGMVFQSYALFPNMTAGENIAFGLSIRRQKAQFIKDRVAELLSMVNLQSKINNYPHQLSGGEQQRVALARALAPQPRVLLLDEPLSALDARIRLTLRMEIRRIQRSLNITTLYVTHDQEEALTLSDRIMVFNAGKAEQIGTPRDIYDKPRSDFVSQFVGSVNQLQCQVLDPDQGMCRVTNQDIKVDSLPPDCQSGDIVRLWIRPERIHFNPDPSADNVLNGVITDVIFLGARTGLRIDLGGQEIMADTPRDPFHAMPDVGDRLTCQIPRTMLVTREKSTDLTKFP